MSIKLVIGGSMMNVISVYPLHVGLDEKKNVFWEVLDEMVRDAPSLDKLFVRGILMGIFGRTQIDLLLLRKADRALCKDCKVIFCEILSTQHKLLVTDLTFERRGDEDFVLRDSENSKKCSDYGYCRRIKVEEVKETTCRMCRGRATGSDRFWWTFERAMTGQSLTLPSPAVPTHLKEMALLFTISSPPTTRLYLHSSSTFGHPATWVRLPIGPLQAFLGVYRKQPLSTSSELVVWTAYTLSLGPTLSEYTGFCNNPIALQTKSYVNYYIQAPFIFKEKSVLFVKVATDVDNGDSNNTESDEESLSLDNLPLESKLQLKLEQKMKMKFAKNIKLRRKKLVRKRRLRKKGRWPPSKLKKNKNV
ncbi:putative photosystem II core complex proteins psbY, chloroplastic-like [Capsicum annuum]|nr:putative photosystem II core complex proteins psbY, chloroplastic-like [Capsicum annuum]